MPTGAPLSGRVEVVAHRGASSDAPEHTLSAYRRAIEQGADALESDVRLTRDGHLICVHDRRINRTSSGRGLVSTLELSHLETLDWGSWMGTWEDLEDPELPDRDRSSLLTLDKLLATVADARAGGRHVELAIETKHPTRYAGLVEQRLVELLDRYGWAHGHADDPSPVRVMSFSQMSMRRMRQLAPTVPTVFLLDRYPLRFRDGSLPSGATMAGPGIHVIREHPRYVARAHRRGHPVHVWTVDTAADVRLCLDLGVDTIITNRPSLVLGMLGRDSVAPSVPAVPALPAAASAIKELQPRGATV